MYIKAEELPRWLVAKHFKDKDLISLEELIDEFGETSSELEQLKEKFADFKQDVEDNYKFMPTEEQIGYSHEW